MLQAEGVWTGEEQRALVACLVVDCGFDDPAWLNGQLACVWGPRLYQAKPP